MTALESLLANRDARISWLEELSQSRARVIAEKDARIASLESRLSTEENKTRELEAQLEQSKTNYDILRKCYDGQNELGNRIIAERDAALAQVEASRADYLPAELSLRIMASMKESGAFGLLEDYKAWRRAADLAQPGVSARASVDSKEK